MSEKLSLEDAKYSLNTAGLGPRSHAYVDLCGDIIVKVQVPLTLDGGTQIPVGAGRDIRDLVYDINEIVWKEDSARDWRLTFFGNGIRIVVGADVTLPEGHDISNGKHWPFIHQGNDAGRAVGVYRSASKGRAFNLVSVLETFSWMSDKAVAELLRHGPGHKLISVNSKEIYADLFPHLAWAFPWIDTLQLPFPLKDVGGWISQPIPQEG